MRIQILTFLTFLLFITGCGGASPSVTQIPSWFLNPPKSDPIYYYGVGEGKNVDAAKANALAQIGGSISTTVSSNMQIDTEVTNGDVNEAMRSQTKASVDAIKFTGVEVVKSTQQGMKIYTKVRVDRHALFDAQKTEFNKLYKKLNTLYSSSKESNILNVLRNTAKMKKLANASLAKLPILKTIETDFNASAYQKKILSILSAIRDAKRETIVYVTSKSAQGYMNVLKSYISSYGMTLVDNPKSVSNKKNLLRVNVSISAKQKHIKTNDPRLKGASFAEVVVALQTKDYKGEILGDSQIDVLNISKDGYKKAVLKTKKFAREIERRGVLQVLLGIK